MNSKVQIILGKYGLNIAWKSKEFFSFRIVKLYIGPTLPTLPISDLRNYLKTCFKFVCFG